MFCQVRDFGSLQTFLCTNGNTLCHETELPQRWFEYSIPSFPKIRWPHHQWWFENLHCAPHKRSPFFFLDVRCKIEHKLNPIFGSLSKKYRLPMSSPVGVQWLYWTGIEGCKRGATITYHNHDLYTSRIPGAFIIVHVKKAASVHFCLALDRLGSAANKPAKWNEISPRCKNAMPSANESYCWSVC